MSAIESTKPGAFISLSAAADMLGIGVHTLRRRIAAGELPAFRTGKRIIRVRVTDLEKLLRRVPATQSW
ncbi:MAG: helix-turn-helix domain-containing protein [Micropruina sp.]|nr:MAG: helix-turn-helix domain-containing protein [Micropruina sp.]